MKAWAWMTSTSGWRVGLCHDPVPGSVRKEMRESLLTVFLIWQRKERRQRTYRSSWSGTSLADSLSVSFLFFCVCFVFMRNKGHIVCMSGLNIGHIV